MPRSERKVYLPQQQFCVGLLTVHKARVAVYDLSEKEGGRTAAEARDGRGWWGLVLCFLGGIRGGDGLLGRMGGVKGMMMRGLEGTMREVTTVCPWHQGGKDPQGDGGGCEEGGCLGTGK
jgi:hypothetical protein